MHVDGAWIAATALKRYVIVVEPAALYLSVKEELRGIEREGKREREGERERGRERERDRERER